MKPRASQRRGSRHRGGSVRERPQTRSLLDLLRRPGVTYDTAIASADPGAAVSRETLRAEAGRELADQVIEQIETSARYAGYVDKQRSDVARASRARLDAHPRRPRFRLDPGVVVRGTPILDRAPAHEHRRGGAPSGNDTCGDVAASRPRQEASPGGFDRRGSRAVSRRFLSALPRSPRTTDDAELADGISAGALALGLDLSAAAVGALGRLRATDRAMERDLQPDRHPRSLATWRPSTSSIASPRPLPCCAAATFRPGRVSSTSAAARVCRAWCSRSLHPNRGHLHRQRREEGGFHDPRGVGAWASGTSSSVTARVEAMQDAALRRHRQPCLRVAAGFHPRHGAPARRRRGVWMALKGKEPTRRDRAAPKRVVPRGTVAGSRTEGRTLRGLVEAYRS